MRPELPASRLQALPAFLELGTSHLELPTVDRAVPKSGDAITFVREFENLSFSDAVQKLASRAGIAVAE